MPKEDSEPSYSLLSTSNVVHTSNLPTVDIDEVPEITLSVNTNANANQSRTPNQGIAAVSANEDIDTWIDLASLYVNTNKSLPDEYKELKLRTRVHGVANVTFKRLIKEHSNVDSGEELEVDWNIVWEGMKQASEEWRARQRRVAVIGTIVLLSIVIGIPMITFLAVKFGGKKSD